MKLIIFLGDTVLQILNKNKSRAKLYIIKIINIVHRANKVMSKDESLLMRPKDSQDNSVHCAQLQPLVQLPRTLNSSA